jgi:hypothetical protein
MEDFAKSKNAVSMLKTNNQQIFNDTRYVFIKDILDKEIVTLASQYALFDEIQNFQPETGIDAQTPGTHSQYADPLMEALLLKLHPTIEEHTGLALHPTYSYYRVYKSGDILAEHIDRPSCEISVTVCFNFDYKELNGEYDWPIWMVDTPCVMEPGDGVIYHGCELNHWRDKFEVPDNAWHVQAFFHYVDANGPHADCRFDTRPFIGYKPQNTKQISTNVSNKKYITFTG